MKVPGLTDAQLAAEMRKTLRVRAKGEPDIYVGYYNHLRRHGGDVFVLRPMVRKREFMKMKDGAPVMIHDPRLNRAVPIKEMKVVLITAEMQFSEKWMERINVNLPETRPRHFNEVGRGNLKNKLNIPGMTSKVGVERDSDSDPNYNGNDNFNADGGDDNSGGDQGGQGASSEDNVI